MHRVNGLARRRRSLGEPVPATRQGCDEGAGNAQSHASRTHARPHRGGAWGWAFPRGRRDASIPAGRRRDGHRLRADRPARSTGGTRPSRPSRPVPAPHHDPTGRGDRRDDRARDGRPGRPADRQLRRSRSTRANVPAATARAGLRRGPGPSRDHRAGSDAAGPGARTVGQRARGDAVLAAIPGAPGRTDAGLSPRLRPGCADRRPELLSRPVTRDVPRRAGGQPHLPAGAGSRGSPRRRHRRSDHRCRPLDLRPRRRHRQHVALSTTSARGTRSSTWSATWLSWASTSTGSSSRTVRDTRPTMPWHAGCSSTPPDQPANRAAIWPLGDGRHARHRGDHEPAAASLPLPAGRQGARARCRAAGWWPSRT